MKTRFLLPLIALLFCGCNNFYHVRYPHLKKVPANGRVAFSENSFTARKNVENQETSLLKVKLLNAATVNRVKPLQPSSRVLIQKNQEPVIKKKSKPSERSQAKHARQEHQNDKHVFLSILLVILFIFLIIYGLGLLVIGLFAPNIFLIVGGVVIFLLGFFPLAGAIRKWSGKPTLPERRKVEEK